jgi:hypothetical protein
MRHDSQDPVLAEALAVERRSPAERAAHGKAARRRIPRSAQARFAPPAGRFDPVALLERQSADRVPELVPIRYGRMLESPFRFYRGAAGIMAADLGPAPDTGLIAQLCGDAHLLNFRLLASPERHLVFDINDFDETLPGPFEWDLKRLATSLEIAARARGFEAARRAAIVRGAVEAYRERMQLLAGMGTLDIWYAQDDTAQLEQLLPKDRPDKDIRKRTGKALAKARTRDTAQAVGKLTRVADGRRAFVPDPPLITPLRAPTSKTCCTDCCTAMPRACRPSGSCCCAASRWWTWPARSSASAVSAHAAGSSSGSGATTRTRWSSRPRRPAARCSPRTSRPAARTATRGAAWCTGSGSCSPRATSCSAGCG